MLLAVELEARPMPDVPNGVPVDVAHACVSGNVIAAHHHVATAVDVQTLEDERARHLIGVEIDARIGRSGRVESGIDAPSQKLAFDEVVYADFLNPIALDRVDIDAVLIDSRRYHLGRATHFVTQAQLAAYVIY